MPSRLTLLPGLALAAILAAGTPTLAEETAGRDTVVAVVNGQEIKLGHMALAFATLPQEYQQLPSDVLFTAILDQLIQQTALSQAQGDDVPAYVAMALENERRSLLAGENLDQTLTDAISEDDLRAAYDAEFANVAPGEEYNAAHILVETVEEALAIKADLDAGADFAETAREKSTGPSGPNGGDLGWFGTGRMVPDFEAAVIALEPGDISDPVQTQFGWHVILLRETRPVSAPEFETVRGQLLQRLQGEAMDAYVSGLTQEATIDRPDLSAIEPDTIRSLDILRN
jgi:peptidyl-prolyl cis-trans isomerase C